MRKELLLSGVILRNQAATLQGRIMGWSVRDRVLERIHIVKEALEEEYDELYDDYVTARSMAADMARRRFISFQELSELSPA